MHRVPFSKHQRDELQSLGVCATAIDCIEVEALPTARLFLKRPPRKNDVRAELHDVYRVPSLTQYGEEGQRVEGVELVDGEAVLERVSTRTAHWRMKPKAKPAPKAAQAKTSVKTGPGRCGRG